jgi:hypothetical protein
MSAMWCSRVAALALRPLQLGSDVLPKCRSLLIDYARRYLPQGRPEVFHYDWHFLKALEDFDVFHLVLDF